MSSKEVGVLRLLDEGHSVNSIAKLYGEGRYKTINKLRHQLDDGEIVLSEGKYVSVDLAQKRGLNFSGEAVAVAAAKQVIVQVNKATVDEATIMTGNKLDVGPWAINTYTAVAAKYSKTLEQFLDEAASFLLVYHWNVDIFYHK